MKTDGSGGEYGMSGDDVRFFAAANTAGGFVSWFGDIFGPGAGVGRLFVLKGGPGTGKSRFLREVGRYAEARGYAATYYACSSDPGSLDGLRVSIPGQADVGLLDGTAPHAWELSLPGAREELIDLGRFWDGAALRAHRDRIAALGAAKAAAFARAGRWLSAAGEAARVQTALTEPLFDGARLDRLASRLLRSPGRPRPDGAARAEGPDVGVGDGAGNPDVGVGEGNPGCPDARTPVSVGLRRAFSMSGRARLDTYERLASRVLCAGDRTGAAYALTRRVLREALRQGRRVLVSYDPLLPERIDGLFLPDNGLCVLADTVSACAPSEKLRALPLRRYTDTEALHRLRPTLREAASLCASLTDCALRALADGAQAHFALETIYAAAMDFPEKERMTERFCRETFG